MNLQPQQQPAPPAAEAPPALPQWVSEADSLNLQGEHRLLYELLREFHSFDAADKPDKFKYSSWNKWEESVYIYLDSIVSKSGAHCPMWSGKTYLRIPSGTN